MKDRREVPMKGDRALVIAGLSLVGSVIDVASDPYVTDYVSTTTGRWCGPVTCNEIGPVPNPINGLLIRVIPTAHLLRLPPDSESKRLFAETSRKREKVA